MSFQNRAADARLGRIEKALQSAENRLDAAIVRDGLLSYNETDDKAALHDEIKTLLDEAARLHPASAAGIAAKARIVVKNYDLGFAGQSILYSLIEDLQVIERRCI